MKFDSLMSVKEYLHLAFLTGVFVVAALSFDVTNEVELAWSFIVIGLVSLPYALQNNTTEISYWNFGKTKQSTDYQIIGPFGFMLLACWIAFVDYQSPVIISKISGIILLLALMGALPITVELTRRGRERLVAEHSAMLHLISVWVLMGSVFLIATRLFLVRGTWEWDIPNPLDMLNTLMRWYA